MLPVMGTGVVPPSSCGFGTNVLEEVLVSILDVIRGLGPGFFRFFGLPAETEGSSKWSTTELSVDVAIVEPVLVKSLR